MNRRKSYIIFLMLVLLLALFGCKKKSTINAGDQVSKNQDHSNDPLKPSEVDIDTIVYEDKEGDVVLDTVKVDQIILPERYVEKYSKLNDAIALYNESADEEGKQFYDSQKYEIRAMRSERNDNTLALSYEGIVTVNRIDDDVFSFMEEITTYTGGAHGSYAPIGRNYIPSTGEVLTSDDIFSNKNKLKEVLIKNIKEGYSEEELFPEWEETLDAHFSEKKKLNILVGSEFVDVMFDPYYLAPWSTGTITITLPYDKYSDILNKRYFR